MALAGGGPVSRARDSRLPAKIAGYRLDGYIGQGSMATVYRAADQRRQVALKVLAPDLDAALRAQVIRDSRAAAALEHPHIIPVYEAGEADGIVYVAMRYVSGGDARSLLDRLGPLPLGHAWRLIAAIASALDAAHSRGLVHGDVRPANILLAEPAGHPYLSDFGMSRPFSPGQVIAAGEFAGTLDYMAPERIEGRDPDGRADLYSLACTGFELLCGTPPFGQEKGPTLMYAQLYAPPPSAAAARADLPAATDAVLATALAKDPADRYPSCGRFAEDLRSALGVPLWQPPGRAPDVPAPEAAAPRPLPEAAAEVGHREPAQRTPFRIAVAAAVVVVAAAAVALGLAWPGPSAPGRPAASPPTASQPAASPPSPSSGAPSEQAATVSAVLASSAATRAALRGAVRQVRACRDLSHAVSQLRTVVSQRITESRQAAALATAALPDGAAVKSELASALRTSMRADRDYLTWAQQQQAACTPSGQSAAYSIALRANQAANAAKQAFARIWNRVATKYGLRPIRPDGF